MWAKSVSGALPFGDFWSHCTSGLWNSALICIIGVGDLRLYCRHLDYIISRGDWLSASSYVGQQFVLESHAEEVFGS